MLYTEEQIEKLRIELYDSLPTGNISAAEVMYLIQKAFINLPTKEPIEHAASPDEKKCMQDAYELATLRSISDNPEGTRMDVIFLAMDIYAKCCLFAKTKPSAASPEGSKTGVELIAEERKEQIEKHGWNLEHDTDHKFGELAKVAATLAVMHTDALVIDPNEDYGSECNPWGLEEKLGGNHIHALKVAGALIAAEIDRLNNLNKNKS